MTVKQEFSSSDSAPAVLYAKTNPASLLAYPLIATSSGCLLVSEGIDIPAYDSIVISYSSNLISSVYYLVGGVSGALVATLTLSYSGSNIISVVRT